MKQKQLIYILIVVLIGIIVLLSVKLIIDPSNMPGNKTSITPSIAEPTISTQEQESIEIWIKMNNLNFFGDPSDTVYTGGTPLYDETSGETQDRFDYILKNHPEKPWNN